MDEILNDDSEKYFLFPSPNAVDVDGLFTKGGDLQSKAKARAGRKITLFAIDATWCQAKNLFRFNQALFGDIPKVM